MHAGTGLSHRDLGRERHLDSIGVGDLAQHPLGQHHLIGRVAHVHGQEFDFLLDHLTPVRNEVTDLRVGILDGAAHAHQVCQGLRSHVLPLREGAGLVVAALRFDAEESVLRREQVVLELAERLQGGARLRLEGALGLAQDLLRCRGEGRAAHVVEATQELHRGQHRKGAQEGCRQARDDVEVRGGRLDEAEQGGSVDAFAEREDPIKVCFGLNRKIEGFEAPIPADVAKVHHRDPIVFDIADDVSLRELLGRLSERLNEGVRVEGDGVGRKHLTLLIENDLFHMIMSHIAAPNSSYPASLEFVEAAFHRACELFPSSKAREPSSATPFPTGVRIGHE